LVALFFGNHQRTFKGQGSKALDPVIAIPTVGGGSAPANGYSTRIVTLLAFNLAILSLVGLDSQVEGFAALYKEIRFARRVRSDFEGLFLS
jgi:hypothetical protein